MQQESVKDYLIASELRLQNPNVRVDVAAVDALLHTDFKEISQSGRIYGKGEVLDAFARIDNLAQETVYTSVHFQVTTLVAGTLCQVMYKTSSKDAAEEKFAFRSSLWVCEQDEWKMLFHQATPITKDVFTG